MGEENPAEGKPRKRTGRPVFRLNERGLRMLKRNVLEVERGFVRDSKAVPLEVSKLNQERVLDRGTTFTGMLQHLTYPEEAYEIAKAIVVWFEHLLGFYLKGKRDVDAVCELANRIFPGKRIEGLDLKPIDREDASEILYRSHHKLLKPPEPKDWNVMYG
jgi:hypothetical protein